MAGTLRYLSLRIFGLCALATALVGLSGCGSKGTLNGKVTYKEQPLPQGTILTFLNVKSDRSFPAQVGEGGTYKVEGLPTGEYKIAVKPPTAVEVPQMGGGNMGKGKKEKPDKMGPNKDAKDVMAPPDNLFDFGRGQQTMNIPTKYLDTKSTTLTVTVSGGKQEHNIPLTD